MTASTGPNGGNDLRFSHHQQPAICGREFDGQSELFPRNFGRWKLANVTKDVTVTAGPQKLRSWAAFIGRVGRCEGRSHQG